MATIKPPILIVDASPNKVSLNSPSFIMSGLPSDEISKDIYIIASGSISGIRIKIDDAYLIATVSKSLDGNVKDESIVDIKCDIHKSLNLSTNTMSINIVPYSIAADIKVKDTVSYSIKSDMSETIVVKDTVVDDNVRYILINDSLNVDLSRHLTAYSAIDIIQDTDIFRTIQNDESISASALTNIVVNETVIVDMFTKYETEADITVNVDVKRLINISKDLELRTVRNVYRTVILYASMTRRLMPGPREVTTESDLECKLLINISLHSDTVVYFSVIDTEKTDLKRKVLKDVIYKSSILRRIPHDTSFVGIPAHRPQPSDPFRIWPTERPKAGPVSMEINLNEQTLSDSFSLQTTQEVDINQMISGRIMDFDYCYQIGDVDWTDLTRTAEGMYDVDEILYRMITYKAYSKVEIPVRIITSFSGGSGPSGHIVSTVTGQSNSAISNWGYLSAHAARIGNALNKKVVFLCDNFKCNSTWTGNGNTYQSIISTLFGWSSSIPHLMINVFMRAKDNTLYIVQRGCEQSVIDITDTKHTRPHIKHELERTAWSLGKNSSNSSHGQSDDDSHSSGSNKGRDKIVYTFEEPDGSSTEAEYQQAKSTGGGAQTLLRREENDDTVTTYSYTGGPSEGGYRLYQKVSINKHDRTKVETTYSYALTATNGYMVTCEQETSYTSSNVEIFTRKTTHRSTGTGSVVTQVFEGTWGHMRLVSSSLSVSETVGATTPYTSAQIAYDLTGSTGEKLPDGSSNGNTGGGLPDRPVSSMGGDNTSWSIYDQTVDYSKVPTDDTYVLWKYTQATMWLNRKVKETVEMDIYEYNHVIDFTERIRFRGNEYYLSSNKISQTTRELKQTVTLVRWY